MKNEVLPINKSTKMSTDSPELTKIKPLLRGHFHQEAFFFALGACSMLLSRSPSQRSFVALLVYSLSLIGLFGISALYHRPKWNPKQRMWMRRLDHAAIFLLIAGTSTPIAMLAMDPVRGNGFLILVWCVGLCGILQSLFWVNAPKWLAAILYIGMGWLAFPYMPDIQAVLGWNVVEIIMAGGLIYTAGALVYAFKKPDPFPKIFGYHEIFHILVILAAALHFIAIVKFAT